VLADLIDRCKYSDDPTPKQTGPPVEAVPTSVCLWQGDLEETLRQQTTKRNIFCLVDHTHSAAAECFDDTVVGNGLAD
jgi:hypothetical protein